MNTWSYSEKASLILFKKKASQTNYLVKIDIVDTMKYVEGLDELVNETTIEKKNHTVSLCPICNE